MTRREFQDKRDREVIRDLQSLAVLQFTVKTRVKQTRVDAMVKLCQTCFADDVHVLAQINTIADRMLEPVPEDCK